MACLFAICSHESSAFLNLSRNAYPSIESDATTVSTNPSTNLPLNDINIVILTDVHSWVAGHGSHDPHLNAGYGDILSFYQHLQAVLDLEQNYGKDLFFVMNGDFLHGTGLSTDPPTMLVPILEKMPWDAVNIGNHELLYKSTIEYISKPNGFIDYWKGTYLTSNVRLAETGKSLGSRYTFLKGSSNTVLTFGFLYDMINEDPSAIVDSVENVVKEPWFHDVLQGNQGSFDAIVVLAHMDFDSPHAHLILETIRSICGDDMTVQFISGHSHLRATEVFDEKCISVEAGRFMDTVGFVSFSNKGEFQHEFIDANIASLASTLNLQEDELSTKEGLALTKLIHDTQEEAGLLDLVACSPENYFLNRTLDSSNSLWGLYMKEVVPNHLFQLNSSKIMIQERHDFWYNLYSGESRMQISLNRVSQNKYTL